MAPLASGAVGATLLVALSFFLGNRINPDSTALQNVPTTIRGLVVDVDAGHARYMSTCSSCHGPSGQGMPMQGVDLTRSVFVATRSDEQLLAFLILGRQPGDRHSVMGRVMPPRGGNAGLDDNDLADIIAYLRQVQVEARDSTETPTLAAAVRHAGR